MKQEYLVRMSAKELDDYAKAMGISRIGGKSAADKVEAINKRREKSKTIEVMGLSIEIPVKRFHDKKVRDVFTNADLTDDDLEKVMRLVIGDEQMDLIVDACIDEDGTFDVDALGYAFTKIFNSAELKNF